MDVLPVFALEQQTRARSSTPRNEEHADADCLRVGLRRLAHVDEVVDQVGHAAGRTRRARSAVAGAASSTEARLQPASCLTVSTPSGCGPCRFGLDLQLDAELRPGSSHSTCGIATFGNTSVVPAGSARRVAVEAAQVGVEPVGAARARDDATGPGGTTPNAALASFGSIATPHGLAHLVGGEQQVVLICASVRPRSVQAVVAHVRGAVAVQAVVHEHLRAALQRHLVVQVDRRASSATLRAARRQRERRQHSSELGQTDLLHHHVTRSRLGLPCRCAVYHGISRKNRK